MPSPIPSIQTSLLTPTPCWLGQMLPGLRSAGVRAYMARRAPENPLSARPASAPGTTGASSADPSAISLPASNFRNWLGGMSLSIGKAFAAMLCRALALASSPFHFSRPECTMKAPVAIRPGRSRALSPSIILPFCLVGGQVVGVLFDHLVQVHADRPALFFGELAEQPGRSRQEREPPQQVRRQPEVGQRRTAGSGSVEREPPAEYFGVNPADRLEQP